MKIIALIPAKNEGVLLPMCLESLLNVADEVIVYDDHSTDDTVIVAQKYGAVVISENYTSEAGWPEYEIRERLLLEARSRNATHILSLDADEALTPSFAKIAREYLTKLKSGDTLSLRWITLWKNTDQERVDGVFKNLYKDFAFCDDTTSHHQYAFLGVGRVPFFKDRINVRVPSELGGILHFQYALWERTQIKQAWYRCAELTKGHRDAKRINHTYSISLDGSNVQTAPLSNDWEIQLNLNDESKVSLWQLTEILREFDERGILFFEALQIWHIETLRNVFIKKIGREPKSKVYSKFVIKLNTIRHKLKLFKIW